MTSLPDLDSLLWQNRVVIIFATGQNDAKLKKQNKMLDGHSQAFTERDIKVFRLSSGEPGVETLRDRLQVARTPFAVVLLGKDGSVKLRGTEPLSAEELFRTIDRMPMRRDEVKQRGDKTNRPTSE